MLAGYSYLGLIGHKALIEAVHSALLRYGTGVHGARLLAGTNSVHVELESELANFMNSESAIVYSSGFLTNTSVISALVQEGDTVIGDEFIHTSLAEGCRNSSAEFRMFRHNDLQHLESILKLRSSGRCLVIVDAVYSMEGDIAPLNQIVQLSKKYEALLMVDEAHSLGVLGGHGRGIQEHFDLAPDAIDIKMGNTV